MNEPAAPSGRCPDPKEYSREALEGTREQVRRLRTRGSAEARLEITEVAEFELALAHLDVPELV